MSDYYGELAAGGGAPARLDGWRHRLEQWLRFEVVCRGLLLSPESTILDVGCGTGRLVEYLKTQPPGRYVGLDLRSEVLERARERFSGRAARFVEADWSDLPADVERSFDCAVAIGTMVDGEVSDAAERQRQLRRLVERLDESGESGWALVALDQTRLEADPVRSLEPYLKGARAEEVREVLRDLGVEALVDREVVPTDLVVIHRRGEAPSSIAERIAEDAPHEAVLERARKDGDIDTARRVWFWMTTGRLERARRVLETMPDAHLQKKLLSDRLRLRD